MRRLASILVVLAALWTAQQAIAVPFGSQVVFGDSLSDGGNAAVLSGPVRSVAPFAPVPSAPYLTDRFSNGPVAADLVADALGVPRGASLVGGPNFALGGARTGPASFSGLPLTLRDQADLYLAGLGGPAPADALYWIWGGGNDLRDATPATAAAVIGSAVGNIAGIIGDLAAVDARNFVVLNAPDLGMTPEATAGGPAVAAGATALSAAFNAALAATLDGLVAALSLDLVQVDVFGLMQQIAASPAVFGLVDVTTPCLVFGVADPDASVCADPDAHLFWDAIHPTAAAHRIVADVVLLAIPEPGVAWLFAIGLLVLAVRRRAAPARGAAGASAGQLLCCARAAWAAASRAMGTR